MLLSLWHLFCSPHRGAHSCEQDNMLTLSAPVIFASSTARTNTNGEAVHTRGTCTHQVICPLYLKVRMTFHPSSQISCLQDTVECYRRFTDVYPFASHRSQTLWTALKSMRIVLILREQDQTKVLGSRISVAPCDHPFVVDTQRVDAEYILFLCHILLAIHYVSVLLC
ncbi:hypothetical protein F5148DRAFT_616569 [Russula earlei]|uniref:Uncharacterized protein n=1 Tax=Russula earlei TaxID=71964 RepID=A0ACC0UGQ9_9AGAM|nr:hypothetical protein F5148DRAFT_616569 [Russula earlei]